MEKVRILSTQGVYVSPKRRSGNTIRIVDNAIQQLYDGYIVKVKDHHDTENMYKYVFGKILDRIRNEHNLQWFDINKRELEISLKDDYYE